MLDVEQKPTMICLPWSYERGLHVGAWRHPSCISNAYRSCIGIAIP
jgi:hypothetical protein